MVPPGTLLRRLALGYMTTYAVRAAVHLKLVDAFGDEPRDATAVAADLGVPAGTTLRLLRALAVLGLFTEDPAGRFVPTDEGRLLGRDHPRSMGAFVDMFTDPVMTRGWEDLAVSVRTGQPGFDNVFGEPFFAHLKGEPEKSALFNASMSEATRAVADALPGGYDFSPFTTVVDVGGGDGTLLTAVLSACPGIRGVVYDSAEGAAAAPARFAAAGVADRGSVVVGDFFAGVPESELYLVKSIIHDWADDRCATILRHCRAAMPEHGRVLVVEPVLPDVVAEDTPVGLYLSDLNMLANVGGRERTRADFEDLCARAGFAVSAVHPLPPTGFCVIEAVPA